MSAEAPHGDKKEEKKDTKVEYKPLTLEQYKKEVIDSWKNLRMQALDSITFGYLRKIVPGLKDMKAEGFLGHFGALVDASGATLFNSLGYGMTYATEATSPGKAKKTAPAH